MEKAGLVERKHDAEDQRVSRVYLTDAGREIRAEMRARLERLAGETLAGFTVEERALLRRLLLQVYENLVRATGQAN
jgi:DNA-binding MarR family transcriptional regulator